MPKTWKAKFVAGDHVGFSQFVPALLLRETGFFRDENLIVIDRSARQRSKDPRLNRYRVTDAATTKKVGWFYEDDLEPA